MARSSACAAPTGSAAGPPPSARSSPKATSTGRGRTRTRRAATTAPGWSWPTRAARTGRVYRRLVDAALGRADDAGYQRVVDLLARWRATLDLHDRAGELAPDVARIREQYKRRTLLLARLDRAGLT